MRFARFALDHPASSRKGAIVRWPRHSPSPLAVSKCSFQRASLLPLSPGQETSSIRRRIRRVGGAKTSRTGQGEEHTTTEVKKVLETREQERASPTEMRTTEVKRKKITYRQRARRWRPCARRRRATTTQQQWREGQAWRGF